MLQEEGEIFNFTFFFFRKNIKPPVHTDKFISGVKGGTDSRAMLSLLFVFLGFAEAFMCVISLFGRSGGVIVIFSANCLPDNNIFAVFNIPVFVRFPSLLLLIAHSIFFSTAYSTIVLYPDFCISLRLWHPWFYL